MEFQIVLFGKLYKAINQSIMKFLLDRVYMTKTKRQGWKGLKLRKNRIERFENFGNFEWVEWNMDRMVH